MVAFGGNVTFNVDITETKALLAGLQFATSEKMLSYWLESVMRPHLQDKAKSRFDSEGDNSVGAWTPLSDATNEIRLNLGFPEAHPINVRTGQLQNFVTTTSQIDVGPSFAGLGIPDLNKATTELKDKMTTAQRGSSNPSTPARPVVGLDASDAVFGLAALGEFIQTTASGRVYLIGVGIGDE